MARVGPWFWRACEEGICSMPLCRYELVAWTLVVTSAADGS